MEDVKIQYYEMYGTEEDVEEESVIDTADAAILKFQQSPWKTVADSNIPSDKGIDLAYVLYSQALIINAQKDRISTGILVNNTKKEGVWDLAIGAENRRFFGWRLFRKYVDYYYESVDQQTVEEHIRRYFSHTNMSYLAWLDKEVTYLDQCDADQRKADKMA